MKAQGGIIGASMASHPLRPFLPHTSGHLLSCISIASHSFFLKRQSMHLFIN